MKSLEEVLKGIHPVSADLNLQSQKKLDRLTKPQGSLGRLECLAQDLVRIFGKMDIGINRRVIFTFAADHGVTRQGVSLYPSTVTAQMVLNFLSGGAAVNVLARRARADVRVIDAGTLTAVLDPRLVVRRIGPGTKDFFLEDAMSRDEAVRSVESGADVFLGEDDSGKIDLAGVGEMGIGNSASAAAILCSLFKKSPADIAGRGTGLDSEGLQRKIKIISESLDRRRPDPSDPMDVLSKVGGFEIGQMAGCFLAGASRRTAMLVDGFISTAAAALAVRLCPSARDYLIFSHRSDEGGHGIILREMNAEPILDLRMRLGEGSGAALAMPIVESAAAIFAEMATFESAGVDGKKS